MLSIGVQEKAHIAGNLQETFVSAPFPRHPMAQQMLKCWHKQPAHGFLIGRDIPVSGTSDPRSYVIAWQPAEDGRDFIARHVGEGLSHTYGNDILGARMSDQMSPELFAYLRHICRQMQSEKKTETLDVSQSHNGFAYLHYEMVLFSASAPDGKIWLVTGLFYF